MPRGSWRSSVYQFLHLGIFLFVVGMIGVLFLLGVVLVATWKGVRAYLSQRADDKRRRHKRRRRS